MSANMQKVLMERSGARLNFGIEFQKATDETTRTVVGFATVDNLDQTGDIVLESASIEAFSVFRGNIREQHNVQAPVGRLRTFEPAEYVNTDTGEIHKGIRVAAYIPDDAAWNKVLNGIYTGFSIGGAILESENVYSSELGRVVKVISKYRLTELSLVDNPGNELANFEVIYKALDSGNLQKGYTEKGIYWCPEHKQATQTVALATDCPECGQNMAKIGTVGENETFSEKLNKVLSELQINTEGVIHKMADENTNTTDNAAVEATPEVEPTVPAEAPKAEDVVDTETVTKEEAEVEEAAAPTESELASAISGLVNYLKQNQVELVAKLDALKPAEASIQKVNTAAPETKDDKIASLESRLAAAESDLRKVVDATALRTSEDKPVEQIEKVNSASEDGWDNIFSGPLGQ